MKATFFLLPTLTFAAAVINTRTPDLPASQWQAGEYPIHQSCNVTERLQLRRGLDEMLALSQAAKSYILEHGRDDKVFRKYFGNASTSSPLGWYERVLGANRGTMLFRCDDPDRNCATQNNWAGHWRGSNATQETVICPRSYVVRRSLSSICSQGYTVSGSPTNVFWASDLLHRVFHVPAISENIVDHFAEDYADVLALAQSNSPNSVRDSDTLQYFALEAYSWLIFPEQGCVGQEAVPSPAASSSAAVSSVVSRASSAVSAASQTLRPTTIVTQVASVTSSAPQECHTHADGVVHCA